MPDDYEDILNRSWDDIPEPQLLPDGNWRLKLRNATYQEAKSADKSPVVLFVYTPVEPLDDVDADRLEELGAEYDFTLNRLFQRFYVENGRDWATVKRHVAKHGVDTTGRSIKESLEVLKGSTIIGFLAATTYTNAAGEQVRDNEIKNFAADE